MMRALPETTLVGALLAGFQLPEPRATNVCCLRRPVCGTGFWQPEQTPVKQVLVTSAPWCGRRTGGAKPLMGRFLVRAGQS